MNPKQKALAAMGLCVTVMLTGCGKSDEAKYADAQKLVREGAYDEAITAFTEIDGYEDSSKYLMYIKAIQLAESGEWDLAASSLNSLGDFSDSQLLATYYRAQGCEAEQAYEEADTLYRTIATFKDSAEHIAAMPDLIQKRDIAARRASARNVIATGGHCTIGLKSDGTVVAVGENDKGQCNVSDWTDIVAVAIGWNHTVGLKSDGTVVATGNNEDGQCNVSGWTDISGNTTLQ